MTPQMEQALRAVANMKEKKAPFAVGQPLWVHDDTRTCWIPIAFILTMWRQWYAACVREDQPAGEEHMILCSWLTDRLPSEPVYAENGVRLADYRVEKWPLQ